MSFPRLVIDNSSSVSSIPSVSAKRSSGKCHLSGIFSSVAHIDTEDCEIGLGRPRNSLSRRPKALGPPKRATTPRISSALVIRDMHIKLLDMLQAQNLDNAAKPKRYQNILMAARTSPADSDQDLRKKIAHRVRALFDASGESPTDFAARMGMEYKQFWYAVKAESFKQANLVRLAASLNLSLDYICCLTDTPVHLGRSQSMQPDYWALLATEQIAELEARIQELEGQPPAAVPAKKAG